MRIGLWNDPSKNLFTLIYKIQNCFHVLILDFFKVKYFRKTVILSLFARCYTFDIQLFSILNQLYLKGWITTCLFCMQKQLYACFQTVGNFYVGYPGTWQSYYYFVVGNTSYDCARLPAPVFLQAGERPLTALTSFPGSGNTWARVLISSLTGWYRAQ